MLRLGSGATAAQRPFDLPDNDDLLYRDRVTGGKSFRERLVKHALLLRPGFAGPFVLHAPDALKEEPVRARLTASFSASPSHRYVISAGAEAKSLPQRRRRSLCRSAV